MWNLLLEVKGGWKGKIFTLTKYDFNSLLRGNVRHVVTYSLPYKRNETRDISDLWQVHVYQLLNEERRHNLEEYSLWLSSVVSIEWVYWRN